MPGEVSCESCGADLPQGAVSCGRCGAPIVPADVAVPPGPQLEPDVAATTNRSMLLKQEPPAPPPNPPSAAATPVAPRADPYSGYGAPTADPMSGYPNIPADPYTGAGATPAYPGAPAYPPPPGYGPYQGGRPAAPPEVWLVGIGLFVIAGILLDPVLRYGGPLVAHMFDGNPFVRAFDDLFLEVFVLIAGVAVVLVMLAILLLRASRVAQLVTCALSATLALSVLIEQSQSTAGAASNSSMPIVTALICVGVIVFLTVLPGARRFFGYDTDRPFGVLVAVAVSTFLGVCAIASGAFLSLAGSFGVKYAWWAVGFFIAGIGLLALNRPLRLGSRPARAVTVVFLAAYVVLAFVVAASQHIFSSPMTVIPCGIGVIAIAGLTLPASSVRHFAQSPQGWPGQPVQPGQSVRQSAAAGNLGVAAAVVVAVVFAAVGFHSASSAPRYDAFQDGSGATESPSYEVPDYGSSDEPSYEVPGPGLTDDETDTPVNQMPAGAMNSSWTITADGDDGLSYQAVFSAGQPQQFEPGLDNNGFTAGQGCDLSGDSDVAVVPVELVITNTSSEADANVGITLDGVGNDSIPGIPGPVMEFEASFSDSGDTCKDETSFGVQSTDTLGPGQSVSVYGFLDITEFYSGVAGKDDIFADTILTVPTRNGSDGGGTFTIQNVDGPGATQNAVGDWEFDLAGTTPGS